MIFKKEGEQVKECQKKEKCENAFSGCFHTFPFLEEAIICLPCSHLAEVTLVKEMWVRLNCKTFPIKSLERSK